MYNWNRDKPFDLAMIVRNIGDLWQQNCFLHETDERKKEIVKKLRRLSTEADQLADEIEQHQENQHEKK